ncbi:Fur family transcriptional regulator [Anaerococcus sp. DFU013_CI05]|uniref:Fur family transcriptional regulator n=1 Tax=unclassified Anaerococcus TaxID=2614126 RepID=UPI001932D807|nr:Fur family transcriptional regulator [Anaerococcus sp. mt242]MBM0046559.1 transcriptional repressor [Anaerococcus sp. mt242]
MTINDLLREKDLKVTKNRKIILEALQNEENPISAEELFDKLNVDYDMDLSTIYRNLNILEEKSVLLKTTNLDGLNYYQINNSHHKHFITCNNCHNKFVIENCPVHDLEEKIEKETGFIINGHNFEFTGICPDCQNEK